MPTTPKSLKELAAAAVLKNTEQEAAATDKLPQDLKDFLTEIKKQVVARGMIKGAVKVDVTGEFKQLMAVLLKRKQSWEGREKEMQELHRSLMTAAKQPDAAAKKAMVDKLNQLMAKVKKAQLKYYEFSKQVMTWMNQFKASDSKAFAKAHEQMFHLNGQCNELRFLATEAGESIKKCLDLLK
jgi:hypothetical protein